MALRLGDAARAADAFRQLLEMRPGEETERLGRYWLGVTEQRLGRHEEAGRILAALAAEYPLHYYGVHAARRLRSLPAPAADPAVTAGAPAAPPDPFPPLALAPESPSLPDLRAAFVLARAGLPEEAARFARRAAAAAPADKALALLAVRASAAVGDYRAGVPILVRQFGRFLVRPSPDQPADLRALGYPRAFAREVEAEAVRYRLDPLLLMALMRQESRFDPRIRSAVGAVGLFQVMPYTGAALGAKLGVPNGDEEEVLMDPATSARMGAHLVRTLVDMFDNALVPAIAAYNAGEDRVSVWWKAAGGVPEDLFVDSIPYSETRRYVREVLTNYYVYQDLYGTPASAARAPGAR
jgi:soluble lytic murein transglycosylase